MKLPIPSFSQKHPKLEYYLALLLLDEKVNAVILQEVDGALKVIDSQEERLKHSLEEAEKDEWIEAIDKAISRAEEKLPPDIETHKTVFGVKEEWTDEASIKKEYLDKLKEVGQALDLKPIGFIVNSEAIIKLIQEEDGSPLSAVLVEESDEKVTVRLIRAGKQQGKETIEKKDSFAETIDEALKHFTDPTLPPRIILSLKDENEEKSQELIAHHWSKSLPFLHVPQITTLPDGFAARAVVAGAAAQMGFEVPEQFLNDLSPDLPSPNEDGKEVIDEKETDLRETEHPEEGITHGRDEEKEEVPDGKTIPSSKITNETFGFSENADIEKESFPPTGQAERKMSEVNLNDEEKAHFFHGDKPAFGFSDEEKDSFETHHSEDKISGDEEPLGYEPKGKKRPAGLPIFSALSPLVKTITGLTERIAPLITSSRFSKLFLLVPVILVILIGIIFLYLFKMHATVTLYVKANDISVSKPVTFSTSQSSEFSQNIIAATPETADLDGNVSTNATGSKEVGNKAKGKVTIYNSSSNTRTIAAYTVITSATSNKLSFTLDDSVTVASASGDIFSGTKPGTAQVSVTASGIGMDYNLPSGTTFNIGGDSTLAAKNDSAFSGGTKKSVTVVSDKDKSSLTDKLKQSLEKRAMDVLGQKLQSGETLFPVFIDETLTKTNYSKSVGDQANSISLEGTVSFTGAAYKKDDLTQFATAILKSQYNGNISIADGSLKYDFANTKQKDNNDITSTITIHAGSLPKLNTNQIAQEIAGKSLSDAEDILNRQPQVNSSNIKLSPSIPLLPQLLPRQPGNIAITVSTNE